MIAQSTTFVYPWILFYFVGPYLVIITSQTNIMKPKKKKKKFVEEKKKKEEAKCMWSTQVVQTHAIMALLWLGVCYVECKNGFC